MTSLPDTLDVPETTLWQDLRDALRGSSHDYTQGTISRAIFLLSVPMVLEMAMESLFAVSDVFFVSKLGADAIATVGLTESLMIVVYTIAMGLSISATAIVARRVGERDRDGAARAAVQALTLGLGVSATLALLGGLFTPTLLRFMGASPESVAMRVLWLSNGINIVLGPLLIFGVGPFPHLGVTGAAVATTIGRGTGLVYALSRLVRGTGHLQVQRSHFTIEWQTITRMLRMSLSGTFQVLVGTLSWIALVRLMAHFGNIAMAGYTITVRIVLFALLPAWGLSNAAATMVGQALGAGNPDRAERAVWAAARYNVVFLGAMGLLFLVAAPAIVHAFTTDAGVADVAIFGLRTIAIGFPFFAFGMTLTQSFNGAGDTVTPTRINIGVFWLFEIPCALALAFLTPLGADAVFVSVLVAYTLLAAVSTVYFRRGAWRTNTV